MSETVIISLKESGQKIIVIGMDGKVWMTKRFISDAPDLMDWAQSLEPDVAREIGKALINAAIEMEESK